MKVLVVSHMFPRRTNDRDGIFVFEQIKALREIGLDVRVIYGDANWHVRSLWLRKAGTLDLASAISTNWELLEGVPTARFLYHVLSEPNWHKVAPFTYQLGAQRLVRRLLSSFEPDIIHAHTSLLDGNAARVLSRKFKKPYVITEHTGPFSLLTQQPVARWATRRAVLQANTVIAVSRSLKRDMIGQLGLPSDFERLLVVPNGVDTRVFHAGASRPRAEGIFRWIWVGAFRPVKQPILAIEAFADALKVFPDMTLRMVGDGELEAQMRSAVRNLGIEDRVDISGALDRPALAVTYRQHDSLVVTSSSETFCIVALEALASGIPVLTTACGGPVDLVGGSTRGLIVANDRSEIARGLVNLAIRASSIESNSLSTFADAYSFDKLAKRLCNLYSDLCGTGQ